MVNDKTIRVGRENEPGSPRRERSRMELTGAVIRGKFGEDQSQFQVFLLLLSARHSSEHFYLRSLI